MDITADILEFPTLNNNEQTPEIKDKKLKPKKEKTEKTESEDANEEKEPKPPKEKMIKLSITSPIQNSIFPEYLERLGPTVDDKDRHRVMIVISSPGGAVKGTLAAIDVINTWPEPHVVIAGGLCASAATIFIAHGNLRLAFPSSRFMMHDSRGINDGSISQQEERLRVHKEEKQIWSEIYQDCIGLTKKELDRIIRQDTWFNAMEALNLGTKGLIDGIILKLISGFKYEILMRNGVRKVVDLHNDDYNEIKNLTVEAVKNPSIVEVK